ncbi:MAG: transcriptional regulator [Candidatus Methanophagaceae archaeon]|nr:MAG: transcriptional regulator [Methanophagales archaeon]
MPIEEYIKNGIRDSLKDRFKKRRGGFEIIVDILNAAMEGAKKTEIVYKANLNFKRAGNYLSYLEERQLIENMGDEYRTTEKGKEFLRDYQKMMERLE